ncbi:SagB/ThcOx family dehydrogenase [Thermoproteota archaeon]
MQKILTLPKLILTEGKNLRQTIQNRKSVRNFDPEKNLTVRQLATILWATYGTKISGADTVTSASYAIPSAGGIYPLEIFVVVGRDAIQGEIREGIYRYAPKNHTLIKVSDSDIRQELSQACLGQRFIQIAPISIIIAAEPKRMPPRYSDRTTRYIDMEAGHAAQNLYLICADLGLATVEVGAFIDEDTNSLFDSSYPVLLVMPVGYELK